MTPDEYAAEQAALSERAEQTALVVAASSTLAGYSLASSLGTYLATVNETATILADIWTSAYLGVPQLGLTIPALEADRLTAVVVTILEDNRNAPLPRIARVAKTEPATAARKTAATVMRNSGVRRYRWINDPDPCPICIGLAAQSFPVDQVPQSHPNCACTTIPIRTLRKAAA